MIEELERCEEALFLRPSFLMEPMNERGVEVGAMDHGEAEGMVGDVECGIWRVEIVIVSLTLGCLSMRRRRIQRKAQSMNEP